MRTHQLVLAHVEAELAAGRLTLGGRLPGERALAEQLGISRPSVREAIRALEVLGVVRTATGSGPEAGAVIVADPAAGLGLALRLHVATSGVSVGDVVLSVDGTPVQTSAALGAHMRTIEQARPARVVFQVRRGIHTLFLELEPSWPPLG